jgi:hypothetical protein
MAKKPFMYMSSNEWLGDPTTHFMKTGNALRSDENDDLSQISSLIPKTANGVKVEYDISYESPKDKIHGYKYTDLLTKVVMISPCNSQISVSNLVDTIRKGATDEGHAVLAKIKANLTDKYLLDEESDIDVKDLIILPGTNLLTKEGGWCDMDKIDELVKQGAYVKLHPITAKVWQTMLMKRWGDKCISNDVALYPILKNCEKAYFCTSSETGLSATILGKKLGLIDLKDRKGRGTFEHVYNALDRCGVKDTLYNKLAALFSHPESGFICVYHDNYQERADRYFEHMKEKYKHKE